MFRTKAYGHRRRPGQGNPTPLGMSSEGGGRCRHVVLLRWTGFCGTLRGCRWRRRCPRRTCPSAGYSSAPSNFLCNFRHLRAWKIVSALSCWTTFNCRACLGWLKRWPCPSPCLLLGSTSTVLHSWTNCGRSV